LPDPGLGIETTVADVACDRTLDRPVAARAKTPMPDDD
jgi:hypothetical protein